VSETFVYFQVWIYVLASGSGKTAAFVIPMLTFISNLPPFTDDNRHLGPYALIMAPTRELAQQIESEAQKFATPLGFKCVSIVGGVRVYRLFPKLRPLTCVVREQWKSSNSIYEKGLKSSSLRLAV
jgi:superfamily II DNA/RNA helicase